MFDLQDLLPYVWLVLVGLLGAGIYQALNYWAIRQRDYPRITWTKINQVLAVLSAKYYSGFLNLGPLGLILIYIVSNVAGIYTFTKAIVGKDRDAFRDISVPGLSQ